MSPICMGWHGAAQSCSHGPARSRLLAALETVELWSARSRQRRALRNLPDYVMRDMALSRADIEVEASKPFWQP